MQAAPALAPADHTRDRLRARPLPSWYGDAKLGIFIHWSLFSVPAWAPRSGTIFDVLRADYNNFVPLSPYADWYENALKFPWSPTARHHAATYGDRPYADFRRTFLAGLERWRPEAWAEEFAAAGARYVVLVTKHHDGFCLWPSRVPNPHRQGWHTERDVVGDLARAVRARGMRFGVYYSGGLDWTFNPTPVRDLGEMLASAPDDHAYQEYAEAQCRELIERYRPAVLWNDIAWPTGRERLLALLADYYDAVPDGVVNDRWHPVGRLHRLLRRPMPRTLFNGVMRYAIRRFGSALTPPRPPHCDFRTPEYAAFESIHWQKWEATRGIGHSFSYNRNEIAADLIPEAELIQSFADVVAMNGNLLLNVGPRGEDATIPDAQLARLRALGRWLAANGRAIYGTKPWRRTARRSREGVQVRFTTATDRLYAILSGVTGGETVTLADVTGFPDPRVSLLGGETVSAVRRGDDLVVTLPRDLAAAPAHTLEICCGVA
jgi:alpha-L-fucosidase